MLTFKQIDALYWTATLGSFSSAAEKLHTTQSAITKRIKELEAYFQVEVFNRSSKKVQLTSKGEEIYQLAQELIYKRDSVLHKLRGTTTYTGTIRLGITEITSLTWLPKFIRKLNSVFPNLTIVPKLGMGMELQQGLSKGKLDIAILSEHPRAAFLEYKPLCSLPMAWVGSRLFLSEQKEYSAKELAKFPIIRQTEESSLNSVYEEWFGGYRSENNIFTLNSLFAMMGLVTANFGIACVPVDFFLPLIQANKLIVAKIKRPVPTPVYSVAYHRHSAPLFVEEIYQVAKETCDFTHSNLVGFSV